MWSSSFLSHFDTILFDCDGVLWHETKPIPGAIETLHTLEKMGKRLLFATNNSGKSRSAYIEKFVKLGFIPEITVEPEQVFTSSQAAAHYMANLKTFDKERQKVFTVGESGIGLEMRARGIECIEAMKVRERKNHIAAGAEDGGTAGQVTNDSYINLLTSDYVVFVCHSLNHPDVWQSSFEQDRIV